MKAYIALLAATLMTSAANAQLMPGDAMICKTNSPGAHSAMDRNLVADYLLDVFGKIDAKIPTLSPSAAIWLKTEYDDQIAANGNRYTERSLAASNSLEFAEKAAKDQTEMMMGMSGAILTSKYDIGLEIDQWSKLDAMIIDVQYSQAIVKLATAGLLTQSDLPRPIQFFHENMTLFGQCILRDVIANIR